MVLSQVGRRRARFQRRSNTVLSLTHLTELEHRVSSLAGSTLNAPLECRSRQQNFSRRSSWVGRTSSRSPRSSSRRDSWFGGTVASSDLNSTQVWMQSNCASAHRTSSGKKHDGKTGSAEQRTNSKQSSSTSHRDGLRSRLPRVTNPLSNWAGPSNRHLLRALDHFQRVGAPRDERLTEAVDIVREKRRDDGRWTLESVSPLSNMGFRRAETQCSGPAICRRWLRLLVQPTGSDRNS